ncbi:MAG: hypothetical protein IT236_07985 [Bacteroidia bacterium]|nr:hypothetical protein [Bacteroidia bacterium]
MRHLNTTLKTILPWAGKFGLLLLLIIQACDSAPVKESIPVITSDTEKEVRNAYDAYKTAILNGDGEGTSKLVSSNTMQYYGTLLDMVLTADSNKLMLEGLLEKFTVLAIRQTVDWGRLRAMSGKELFVYAIENGMIGKDAAKTSIGNIEYKNDNLVIGEILKDGIPTNVYTDFKREDGKWRVNFQTLLKANEKSLRNMMQQPGLTENECLLAFFKSVFGVAPSREMWLPVKAYNKASK